MSRCWFVSRRLVCCSDRLSVCGCGSLFAVSRVFLVFVCACVGVVLMCLFVLLRCVVPGRAALLCVLPLCGLSCLLCVVVFGLVCFVCLCVVVLVVCFGLLCYVMFRSVLFCVDLL